jgi:hypothetical protein
VHRISRPSGHGEAGEQERGEDRRRFPHQLRMLQLKSVTRNPVGLAKNCAWVRGGSIRTETMASRAWIEADLPSRLRRVSVQAIRQAPFVPGICRTSLTWMSMDSFLMGQKARACENVR